jgi:hypothetical protein
MQNPALTLTLASLLVTVIFGASYFAVFEIETAGWRKVVKWLVASGFAIGLSFLIGFWAALFPLAAGAVGATFHFYWCAANKIDPVTASPRRRYYQLRGWRWPE